MTTISDIPTALETIMSNESFTATFTVDRTPEEVFAAINDVRGWWSGDIDGATDQLGAEFTYRYADVHFSKQRITELVPGEKVTWLILDSYLSFAEDKTEWNGTTVTFHIAKQGGQTQVRFTHIGLVPAYECFDNCSNAWGFYIRGSLRDLITTGTGQPNDKENDGPQ
jgi:hypothetical protein